MNSRRNGRCSGCVQGCILGMLLAGVVLATVIALWLTSRKASSNETTSTLVTSAMMNAVPGNTSSSSTVTSTIAATCDSWIWNQTGETITITGLPNNGLNASWNLFFDQSSDNLYIADSQNYRVLQWNRPTATTSIVAGITGSAGSGSLQLDVPKDVFVDASGNLYVADSLNRRIQFYLNGTLTGVTLTTSWPTRGDLWGVQMFNQAIYALDETRSEVWMNGTVIASSSLNQPQGFTIDTSVVPGTMYIANSQRQTVLQWSPGANAGQVVAGVDGTSGSTNALLNIPIAVKLDSDANLFVVDNNNHRIQLFCRPSSGTNFTGRMILGTGTRGSTSTTLNYPAGMALDASKNIYVADTSNNRIQYFQRLV